MAMSRATASSNLRAVMAGLEDRVNKTVSQLATSLADELQKATPKDTTHAASNWVWRDNPSYSPEGSKRSVTWGPFQAGLSMAATYTIQRGLLYLTNAVHYIKDLDEGWSPQAPPGFIGLTIRSVLANFTTAVFRRTP